MSNPSSTEVICVGIHSLIVLVILTYTLYQELWSHTQVIWGNEKWSGYETNQNPNMRQNREIEVKMKSQ